LRRRESEFFSGEGKVLASEFKSVLLHFDLRFRLVFVMEPLTAKKNSCLYLRWPGLCAN
jgi:hypothetical protein